MRQNNLNEQTGLPIPSGNRPMPSDNLKEENGLPIPEESARHNDREIREESQQQLSGQVESFSAGEEDEHYNQYRSTHKITPENDEDSEERRIETQQITPENDQESWMEIEREKEKAEVERRQIEIHYNNTRLLSKSDY
jgi:hypothetical protein